MSWSSSDNFFVNSKLEVFSVDFFFEPLELTKCKAVVYDGPKSDDFKRFLRSRNFQVNRQGKVIVHVQKCDDNGEFLECQYDSFLLEMVVPLGAFGFSNVPLPKPQAMNKLQSVLDNTKAELAKNNDELNELRSLLDNTKTELAKKNDELNELKKQKIDQDWNAERFRLTIIAITNSVKRVFVDFGLEPLASGDPESVLRFLEILHDLFLHKEFSATFLVTANDILTSITSIFDKRIGLSIGMETNSSTTPAHLIKNLFTLRGFMDSHFFIDGSVIIRDLHLMNEDDLPIIFRDSMADVAELKQKKKGTKSINNIDKNSIFYGYFNIPMVGMFKGVLTRVHVTLPDEIMVKLREGKHNLNDKRFWFVYANGSGIFQQEALSPESMDNLDKVKFVPSRVLGGQTNFLGFLLRMNRTFVNKNGTYLKFDFIAAKCSGVKNDNVLRYFDKDFALIKPFKLVQFDANECATDIIERNASGPGLWTNQSQKDAAWIVNEALGNSCSFMLNGICFIGKLTKASGTFCNNALVSVFFEQTQHGENCYVDALATTFFVLETEKIISFDNGKKKALEFT
ncbi:uncharacterized protein LOC122081911 isoform X1 [Macadamia integrifolia]|uniref:uncharacterized protein LOC122081911 isoform X1 n=1 Tax=Macadamia integrifolia TaxID=60698 RepID=UPI001C4FE3F4|nr:uncharacterized protein LOC122081911 isoform X1 [Macadamia integrifolia]XP_042505246.1 uncharacterized protein LOC122081911 isoform X1 [Macadamia integrifolia]